MAKTSQNFITARIKKLERELGEQITDPAGANDALIFTYADVKKEKELEARGQEFSNEELRRKQGFQENADGVLFIKATNHIVDKDSKGNVIRLEEKKKEREEKETSEIGA